VGEDGAIVGVDSAPVGAAVADLLGLRDGLATELAMGRQRRVEIKESDNPTHFPPILPFYQALPGVGATILFTGYRFAPVDDMIPAQHVGRPPAR
jgi:hypothetical protein